MNAEIRELLGSADRAARDGDLSTAVAGFGTAGDAAATKGLRRAAIRCYRHGLELCVTDSVLVAKISALAPRSGEWAEYRRALEAHREWPAFASRSAQIVLGDHGGSVTCTQVGPVLEVMMASDDLVDARPSERFVGMPLAMAMVILRPALWPHPREHGEPRSIGVAYAGQRGELDELGDWAALG